MLSKSGWKESDPSVQLVLIVFGLQQFHDFRAVVEEF
jgi:hypothetical protein